MTASDQTSSRKKTLANRGPSTHVTVPGFMSLPAVRTSWELNRHLMSRGYRDYVDAMMQEVKPVKSFDEIAIWKTLMVKHIAAAK